jgi:hypothetical protein
VSLFFFYLLGEEVGLELEGGHELVPHRKGGALAPPRLGKVVRALGHAAHELVRVHLGLKNHKNQWQLLLFQLHAG